VQAAFAPQLGGLFFGGSGGGGGYGWLNLPMLIDVPVKRSAVVFGPRAHLVFAGGGGAGGVIVSLGSSFAYAAQVGDKVRLIPELAIVVPTAGSVGGGGGGASAFLGGGALYTFNFGILVGGR
jgi:hypothetical protein